MRLIDADECPCVLCEDIRNAHCTYEHRSCEKFCHWLNNIAYDVDNVVEELGERSKEYNSGVRLHGKPEEMLTYEAIDIVKRGGVE